MEVPRSILSRRTLAVLLLLAWLTSSGCVLRRYALNQVANAVAHSGTTFASDDDPELVKAAAPFSLKLLESLLSENPGHEGLLSAATSGFTQYAFAFVQQEADELEARDLAAAEALRTRARRLYLRARNYGLRGLEVRHHGLSDALFKSPRPAVGHTRKADVPLLYWTASAWAAAIALSKDDPALVAQLPAVEAMMDRALELNESYGNGAIHSFLISYEMSRPGAGRDPAARAREHFERAMALSGGNDVGALVAMAEAVDVKKQDAKEFDLLLNRALAVNPDTHPATRLVNLVMQRRARWLRSRKADLFLMDNQ